MATVGILQVIQSFTGVLKGESVLFRRGELVDADHPAVKEWPGNFGPVRVDHRTSGRIEQATAAPGEKRGA